MPSSWTTLTTPSVGDPTRQNLVEGIIGNLEYLKGQTDGTTASQGILNGSFESDTDSDGEPDNWTRSAFSGGTVAIDTTEQTHGLNSMKFSGTTGGGTLTTNEFFEVNPEMPLFIQWFQKSDAANVRNKVKIYWYKADKTAATSSTFTIFDRETDNPTSWARMFGGAYPGSDAKFAKLEITGVDSSVSGTSGTTSGTTWIDNVSIQLRPWEREVTVDQPGTFGWVAPAGVYRVLAFATGAGGGTDATTSPLPLYGGGGGGTGADIVDVVPGEVYDVVVGAGGSGSGGSSTFNSSTEGQGGETWDGVATGTGGSYTANFWGQDGSDKVTTTGGSSAFGIGGATQNAGQRGGGAGGGAGSAKDGGDGLIKLFY